MSERVKRLADEARRLTPKERAELFHELSEMVRKDEEDIEASALAECQHHWDDIGAESLGYLGD
jgi:acyl-CoA reductase-like NAD-dependent aldehyde dehydrogenase